MANSCSFCILQDDNHTPSLSLVVEAMQLLIKSLLKKEISENLQLSEQEKSMKKLTLSLENMKDMNVQLENDYKTLKNSYLQAEKRTDTGSGENRCLQVQQLLNQDRENSIEHTTNSPGSVSNFTQGSASSVFVSKEVNREIKKEQVILAPDTYPLEVNVVDGKETKDDDFIQSNPLSPYKQLWTKNQQCTKYNKKNIGFLTQLSCPESLDVDGNHSNMETEDTNNLDQEFTIPSSPVLKNTTNLKRKVVSLQSKFTKSSTDIGDIIPITILKVFPTKRKVKKQTTLNFHKINSPKTDGSSRTTLKLDATTPVRSLPLPCIKRNCETISPIKCDGFDDTKFDLPMNGCESYSSMDDLFNKTTGILPNATLDASSMNLSYESHERPTTKSSTLFNKDRNAAILSNGDNNHENEIHSKTRPEKIKINPIDDSFDRVPEERNKNVYKHKSIFRKKEDRRKLDAKACPQCADYYSDLPNGEREQAIHDVCRHRHEYAPPSTPENFWEIGIPSTAECKRRGYMLEVDDLSSEDQEDLRECRNRRRRKKPYTAKFLTKNN